MYMFISTEKNVKIDIQIAGHIVKGFSLEDALNSLTKTNPERNYYLTGHTTLDQFIDGCKIPLQVMATNKVDNSVDKEKIYNEILEDFKKSGDIMFTKKNEKDTFMRVLGRLTSNDDDLKEK